MSNSKVTVSSTRTEILRTAAELFARRGFTRTSIADITSALGLTKGALYFHFDSKTTLAVEISQAYFNVWGPILEKVHSEGGRGVDALQTVSIEVARAYRDNPLIQAAVRLFSEADEIDADLPVPFEDWINLVSQLLREEQEDGGVAPDLDVDSTAWFLVASFFGTQDISNQMSGRTDIEVRVQTMWKLVLRGILI